MKDYYMFFKWFKEFCEKDEYKMSTIKENSPYHREDNVLVHTKMVVAAYLNTYNHLVEKHGTKKWLLGAFACAFHDIGKPECFEKLTTEDGFEYTSSQGHEPASGTRWVEYFFNNKEYFKDTFGFNIHDMYNVWVMVAFHLPYSYGDKKLYYIKQHMLDFDIVEIFTNVLIADNHGRIADDYFTQSMGLNSFIEKFNKYIKKPKKQKQHAKSHILIGVGGSGKSTLSNELMNTMKKPVIHSLDQVRKELYSDDPETAFKMSNKDTEFSLKANTDFMQKAKQYDNVIVDNTSLNIKRRGIYTNGETDFHILFVPFNELIERNKNRGNKNLKYSHVLKQYNSMYPVLTGEGNNIYFYYLGEKYDIFQSNEQLSLL